MASAILAVLLASMAMRAAAAAGGGCEGDKFTGGRSYAYCVALPTLGARLHWTHDPKTGSLSVAFVAKPAGAGGAGWVSWGINPTGDGMMGTQALLAFRASPASSYVVNTYNITNGNLGAKSTPIAFKPTALAADEAAGEVRIYGKLQLPAGMQEFNHIWQVGSAVNAGAPAKHAFDKENLDAKGRLALSGAALAPAPAPAASSSSSPATGGSGGAGPSAGKPSAAATTTPASALVLMLVALAAGFLAIV